MKSLRELIVHGLGGLLIEELDTQEVVDTSLCVPVHARASMQVLDSVDEVDAHKMLTQRLVKSLSTSGVVLISKEKIPNSNDVYYNADLYALPIDAVQDRYMNPSK